MRSEQLEAERRPMTLLELRDAIAKAIADSVDHGMREKCERQADAVMAVVGPQLVLAADHAGHEFPECTGDPKDCPENEGFGCCNRQAARSQPALITTRQAAEQVGNYKERLKVALSKPAAPRVVSDGVLKTISEIPVVGWMWILVDERTGDDYDYGFSWGKEKPNMDRHARAGTHYDYAPLIGRKRLLRELGGSGDETVSSDSVFDGFGYIAMHRVVGVEQQAATLVQEIPVRGKGSPEKETELKASSVAIESIAPAQQEPVSADLVIVPRGLIGAACAAIEKKREAPSTLAQLRRYTTGDLSAPQPQPAQPSVPVEALKALGNMLDLDFRVAVLQLIAAHDGKGNGR